MGASTWVSAASKIPDMIQVWESNLGHIRGRQVLSLLRHPWIELNEYKGVHMKTVPFMSICNLHLTQLLAILLKKKKKLDRHLKFAFYLHFIKYCH